MKTLAIRLEEEQHAQLSMIAQLEDLTMIDAIRQAINDWVAARRDNPELKQRAQSLLDEIEHDAATRRGAIAALLGSEQAPAGGEPPAGEPATGTPATGNGGSRQSSRNRQRGGEEASG